MPAWYLYRPYLTQLHRQVQGSEKVRRDIPFDEFERRTFGLTVRMQDIISRDVMFMEWAWRTSGQTVWFLESEKLIEILQHSNFQVDIGLIPNMKHPVAISLPGETGNTNGGFLVRKTTVGERRKDLARFYKDMGYALDNPNFVSEPGITDETQIIEVCAHSRTGEMRFRFTVPQFKMDEALQGTFWDDPETFKHSYLSMEQTDRQYEKWLFQIASRLLTYLAVFPTVLKPGFPRPKSVQFGHVDKKGKNNFMVEIESRMKTSPASHYRTWHFRTLRDPRYSKSGPVPRLIFVNSTVVGAIDPHTVEDS